MYSLRTVFVFVPMPLVILGALPASATVVRAAGADIFVAPDGNDQWSGTLSVPNTQRTDGPFATLERARDAIRQLRAAQKPQGTLTVQLRGGTYRRGQPFVLRPEDSGSDTGPVVYEAFPHEKPVISGGKAISGWEKSGGPLWTVALPEVKSGQWCFRQLFVDGQRRDRARLPGKGGMFAIAGLPKVDTSGWMGAAPEAKGKLPLQAFQFRPGDICKDWTNLDEVEVVVLQIWMEARLRIKHIDEDNHVVIFTGGSWRPLTWSNGYYVENVFVGLDTPGSWYLDRKKAVLFYHPLPNEDMDKVEVVAPVAEQLVRIEGDVGRGEFVSNVTFRGLTFCHTAWSLSQKGYMCTQAEIIPPAAVHADGAIRCRIEGCEFERLGAWGIELRRGCKDNTIARNTMRDVGAGCVKIGEPEDCTEDVEETSRTVISDNRFLDGAKVYLGAPGVWIGQSSGNTVRHNEVSGSFMWAISVGWRWSYFPLGRARDNIVEFNHCHHIGTGILGSHCAIYALGTSPGTVIRNNYIHHVYHSERWQGAGEGIILDNGCCGILVENNIVHDAVAGGYGSNFNCYGNIIQNNIFAYGKVYQLTVYGDQPTGRPRPKGEVFARNIIVWKEGPLIKEKDWPDFNTLWDYNLYFREGGQPVTFLSGKEYSLDEWRAKGLGEHSIIADPQFVDRKNRNFALKPDSPAFKLGFKPIDVSTVGPRK
jgi:hypothetical protein